MPESRTTPVSTARARGQVGELLRRWRSQRGMSQLELALTAEVSSRHLSFIETGRAAPSREMVLHLAAQLEVPLRERNRLLQAAGYAPAYSELPLESPRMQPVRVAVRQLLAGHEPYPATAVDRCWNVVDRNAATNLFTEGVVPDLLEPPINVMRLCLHPGGLAPCIVELAAFRARLLGRLRRQLDVMPEASLAALYRELQELPGDAPDDDADAPPAEDVVWPFRFRHKGRILAFFTTVTAFGTPLEITVSELVIEAFFPADTETAEFLHARARHEVSPPA